MTEFDPIDIRRGLVAAGVAGSLLAAPCAAAEPLALAVTEFTAAPVAREMTAAVKDRLMREEAWP